MTDQMLVDPRFGRLADNFFGTFREVGHGGGALAVYLHGVPVVDVWAGWADKTRPWEHDTMVLAFSTGKGVAATVLHRIAERGLIDYSAPVATYWPEFAANGKASITVRDVLCHRAGLHRARGLVPRATDMLEYGKMVDALAAAAPDPRRRHASGYHAITFGWLVSAICERVTGQSFTELVRTEIAQPLGINDFWYHVPEAERGRIAKLFPHLIPPGMRSDLGASMLSLLWPMRGLAEAGLPTGFDELVRDARVHDAVMPGWNGVFSARALARMYGALANNGVIDGAQFLRPETIAALNVAQPSGFYDYVLGYPLRFTLGYHRPVIMAKSQPGSAFGHYGIGGSGAFADPALGLSIAFVTNRLGGALTSLGDARLARLGAIAESIARKPG